MKQLFTMTDKGIYITDADVYIDPWKPVKRSVITHGHSDHARWGNETYLCHHLSVPVLKYRLGDQINCSGVEFGEKFSINGVAFSLHPAGHIPGSAQIRIEKNGQVLVVSGDYKIENDHISGEFEVVQCNTFISESTFGLPIFKWQQQEEIFAGINDWWRTNLHLGKTSILCGYALGKAQRLLKHLDTSLGKIFAHGAVFNINEILISHGLNIPRVQHLTPDISKSELKGALVIAPSSVAGSPWMKKFDAYSVGNCSGWMQVRGNKRRQGIDRGFVVSDHADWDQLNSTIRATGAEKVYITHGYTSTFVKWLNENGINAQELETEFVGEENIPDEQVNAES